jgi:hypothetical protein
MRRIRRSIRIAARHTWLHERLFGLVARRGIEVALRGAKRHLERG